MRLVVAVDAEDVDQLDVAQPLQRQSLRELLLQLLELSLAARILVQMRANQIDERPRC